MEPLRREVMAPRQPVGWLGPLFVLGSTLALTMGMAAMALAPHPRHHHHGRTIHRTTAPKVVQPSARTQLEALEATRVRCGAPVYRATADGMVDATYEVCAQPAPIEIDVR